jgi:hypothetical protein
LKEQAMRISAWIPAITVLAVSAPAAAQGIRLAPGEEAAFALGDGTPIALKRSPATPSPFEVAAGRHLAKLPTPAAPVTQGMPIRRDDVIPPAPVPAANLLRFRLLGVAGTDHTLLVVENGYAQAMTYRATITVAGKPQATDVCLVMPGKPSVEHWPYAITAVELSGFQLVAWRPEDGIPCK